MAERGAAGVELSPHFLAAQRFFVALQRRALLLTLTLTLAPTLTLTPTLVLALVFTLALRRRGVLLCLVSRNLERDVRAVLRGRAAELELREEHAAALTPTLTLVTPNPHPNPHPNPNPSDP